MRVGAVAALVGDGCSRIVRAEPRTQRALALPLDRRRAYSDETRTAPIWSRLSAPCGRSLSSPPSWGGRGFGVACCGRYGELRPIEHPRNLSCRAYRGETGCARDQTRPAPPRIDSERRRRALDRGAPAPASDIRCIPSRRLLRLPGGRGDRIDIRWRGPGPRTPVRSERHCTS